MKSFDPDQLQCKILIGDALAKLKTLPDKSVHACVTSPPYYALRDYGVKGQIGREQTPKQYLNNLCKVFMELHRVLRDDSCLYLNINDTWANSGPGNKDHNANKSTLGNSVVNIALRAKNHAGKNVIFDRPQKSMLQIPARLSIMLQKRGWILRSDIIWHKPACMPTSAKDRPTNTYEHVFFLTKKPKYYYDHEATKEDAVAGNRWITFGKKSLSKAQSSGNNKIPTGNATVDAYYTGGKRNPRDVWAITTKPFKSSHFAVFPPDLVSKALLSCAGAGGVCNHCGTPLVRQIKKLKLNLAHQLKSGANKDGKYYGKSTKNHAKHGVQDASAVKARVLAGMRETKTIGWKPNCNCKNIKPVPATIIDPFAGSGTVGQVAFETKRNAILIELNPEYKKLIKQRLADAKISW